MLPVYAELHCLTNYTFLRGASHPGEQARQAAKLGYAALAITDECSVAGIVRAHVEAKAVGLRLITGSEFRLEDGLKLVLLAENLDGYGNLCELITLARRRGAKGEYRLARADFARPLGGCLALWLPGDAPRGDEARWIAEAFGERAWIAAELLRGADDRRHLERLHALGGETKLRLVAAGDVHMHTRRRRRLQDVLTAVRIGKPVAEAGSALYSNGERHLRSIDRLARLYPQELLIETLAIAERCTFSLEAVKYEYPEELVPQGETAASHLRRLTFAGAAARYPRGVPEKVRAILKHELDLISDMHYEPYFLTVHDIVRYAQSRRILCQGRGSAANSAVCYCLGITEVDPARMQVLFERFISKERDEPPDIDVDFEHQRREEVMQYVFEKYGRDRAAIAATVITYRPKSALRDAGKALGFSLDQVDRLADATSWWDGGEVRHERFIEAGLDPASPQVTLLREIVEELIGFPRHLSQHVGGFVIDNRRLSRLVPIENAAMEGRTVIQWDKDDLDALGLLKVDVLALGMLSCIRGALDLVNSYHNKNMRLQDIPAEDPAVYDMLCRADSIGVFQVESRAQMAMLPNLRPRCYYDLVIQVAIVRPGPIQGKMVHPYLRRRAGLEPVTYPSTAVRGVLERTLGVPIFQEQAMQLAIVAAGFTAGEADRLRRAMAAWRRKGGLDPFRQRLIDGMLARGYSAEYAEQVFRMIRGFGEYGFPESHAASFALLVYVSAWLKRHEPAAFAAALLNAQPLGFYSPSQIIQDAKRHDVEVRPVDVTASAWHSALEPAPGGPAVRLGLRTVKGLSEECAQRIARVRACGPFRDAEDFFGRARPGSRDLKALAEADALRLLAGHRRAALWSALGHEPRPLPLALGAPAEASPGLPPPTEGDDIAADYRRMGFTLRQHPLALLRPRLARLRLASAQAVRQARDGQMICAAGIVTCRQRPGSAGGVTFVTLEDETGYINVVVWNSLAGRQRRELLASRLMGVSGRIQRRGGVVHLIAQRLHDHSRLLGSLETASRDFR